MQALTTIFQSFNRSILLLIGTVIFGIDLQAQTIPNFSFNSPYSGSDRYGDVVAIDGDHAVIGSRGEETLYFYRFDGENWIVISALDTGDPVRSLAIDDDIVVAGITSGGQYQSTGEARVYRLSEAGDSAPVWALEQRLFPNNGYNDGYFGYSIDVKNGVILVGEPQGIAEIYQNNQTGTAHLFTYSTQNETWERNHKFYPTGLTPANAFSDLFGETLSLNENGTRAIINSGFEVDGSSSGGYADLKSFAFRNENGSWVEDGILTFNHKQIPILNDNGLAASYYGDQVVIGGPHTKHGSMLRVGSVFIFDRLGNNSWSNHTVLRFSGGAAESNFGHAVKLTEDFLAVGVPGMATDQSGNELDQGGVVIYENSAGWQELVRIENPDDISSSYYGNSLDFSDNGRLIAGTPNFRNSPNGNYIGKAFIHFVVPTMPSGVQVADGSQVSSVNVSWKRSAGLDGYRIYERGNETAIEILENSSATSFTLNTVLPGTAKELGVASYNDLSESPVVWDFGYTQPNGRISGNITSQGGGGMPGALVTAETEGQSLRAATFDGDGYIAIPHRESLDLTESFTIEAVIRPDDVLDQRQAIYSTRSSNQAGSFSLEIGPGNGGISRVSVTSVNEWVIQTEDNAIEPNTIHHIVYVREGNDHRIYIDGELSAEAVNSTEFINNQSQKLIGAGNSMNERFEGEISEVRLWNRVRTEEEINQYRNLFLSGIEGDLAAYWRLNSEIGNGAIDWANGANGRLVDVYYDLFEDSRTWGVYTDSEGLYNLRNMLYNESGTEFTLTPSFGENEYDPINRSRTLDPTQPSVSQVNFTDITTFTVSGQVIFEGTTCAAPNVDIEVNGVNSGTTDEDGNFSVAILQSGENVIRPVFGEHTFAPAEIELNVISDVNDVEFVNSQRRNIKGQVAGGDCRFSIGEGEITATGRNACFTESVTTDSEGNYSMELPALPDLTLEAMVPANDDINFSAREVSLSDSSAPEDFLYRVAPTISLNGLPELTSCGTRVLSQLDNYFVEIEAFEEYESGTCAVKNGQILINNNIADLPETDTLQINNGIAVHEFTGGNPNIVGGGNRPYQKLLSMEVQTGDTSDAQYSFNEVFEEWAVVEGHRPREQTFTTVSPEIPFFILRDPPGDQSYSFLSEEQSVCRTMSLSTLQGSGSTLWAEAKVGTKFEAGLGVSTETEIWASIGTSLTVSATLISQDEVETCLTTNEEFNTSDSDQFTGVDGDLYVGAAMNILYAMTDVLEYNQAACRVDLSKDIVFGNDGFETEYIYTEGHIRDVVIPDLDRIRSVPSLSADSVAFLSDQIDVWQQTLEMNREIKEDVREIEPLNNYSFSGGTGTSYSITSSVSNSRTIEFNIDVDSEIAAEIGAEVSGSGVSGGASVRVQSGMGEAQSVSRSQENTVGFFLGDDDPGDSFSVDVKSDPVFGTFVFDLVGGTSSCPWEQGSLPRDGVLLTVDSPTQVNVPANEAASFRLTLGNTGQNEETRMYRLNAIPGTNPDGAVLLVNGISLNDLESYAIPDGGSLDQTLTVRRGPSAFDYENLEVVLRSECDNAISDTLSLTVRYESSCSPMELDSPKDGWIVNADSDDVYEISLSGYDRDALNNILFQYSPAGQNNWNTSRLIASEDLPVNSAKLEWEVSNIDDGEYDFRVAVQCDAGVTYTSTVTGSIQRSGLMVVGIPSPGDDILNIGDEIRIQFNRPVKESSVRSENIKLTDLSTGRRIASSFVVGESSITITPDSEPSELQNRLLQASVSGVADQSGNLQSEAATWRFRVRQNPISWNSVSLRENILLGDERLLTATLSNQSSVEESFTIVQIPNWLDASSISGSLQPGETQTISFTPDPLLGTGVYRDTVVAETSLGDERLVVEYGIQCEPPKWEINENSFTNSMNIVADFYIDDVPFSNQNDIVAAFVGEELRGVSRVVPTIPSESSSIDYLYTGFLTVYSNQSAGEEVSFQLWDAAACRTMDITNSIPFEADATIGSVDEPEVFNISGAMLQKIPVAEGTNWISLGVEATNMSVNTVLSRLRPMDGDAIVGQSGFNQYVTGEGWVGQIDSLDPGIMYKVLSGQESSLDLIGQQVDGEDRPISVSQGWNWIGYLPENTLTVDEALVSLTHSGGDIIRSQTGFSQFSENSSSWAGNLNSMEPGKGYKLFRSNDGTLSYPGATDPNHVEPQMQKIALDPGWEINATGFEQVMGFTGRLTLAGDVITGNGAWLSAWIEGELRGVGRAENVLDQWLYFMTINGELDDEQSVVEFKAWHPELGLFEEMSQTIEFSAETVVGSPREPLELFGDVATSVDDQQAGLPKEYKLNQNFPNPFNPATQIDFALPEASDVRLEVYNIIGQRVAVLVNEQRRAGYHNITFDASRLASGVYFYRIRAGSFVETQKMMLVK